MDCFSIVKIFLDSLTNHFDIATMNCKSEVQDFFSLLHQLWLYYVKTSTVHSCCIPAGFPI